MVYICIPFLKLNICYVLLTGETQMNKKHLFTPKIKNQICEGLASIWN